MILCGERIKSTQSLLTFTEAQLQSGNFHWVKFVTCVCEVEKHITLYTEKIPHKILNLIFNFW